MRGERRLAAISMSGTVHEEASSSAATQAAAGPPAAAVAAVASRAKPPINSFVRFQDLPSPGAEVTLVEHAADAPRRAASAYSATASAYSGSAGAQASGSLPHRGHLEHLEHSIAGKLAPFAPVDWPHGPSALVPASPRAPWMAAQPCTRWTPTCLGPSRDAAPSACRAGPDPCTCRESRAGGGARGHGQGAVTHPFRHFRCPPAARLLVQPACPACLSRLPMTMVSEGRLQMWWGGAA